MRKIWCNWGEFRVGQWDGGSLLAFMKSRQRCELLLPIMMHPWPSISPCIHMHFIPQPHTHVVPSSPSPLMCTSYEHQVQTDDLMGSGGRHKILYKLLSLSVSIESSAILSCIAVWMKVCPGGGGGGRALYG